MVVDGLTQYYSYKVMIILVAAISFILSLLAYLILLYQQSKEENSPNHDKKEKVFKGVNA